MTASASVAPSTNMPSMPDVSILISDLHTALAGDQSINATTRLLLQCSLANLSFMSHMQQQSMLAVTPPVPPVNIDVPAVTNECIEERERQRCAVLINLPECDSTCPPDRVYKDFDDVRRIAYDVGLEYRVMDVFRMGDVGTKPRLTKVVFSCSDAARSFIAKFRSSKHKNGSFKGIKVRESQSKSEREAYKRLEKECKAQRKATGKDLIIYANRIVERCGIDTLKQELRAANSGPTGANTTSPHKQRTFPFQQSLDVSMDTDESAVTAAAGSAANPSPPVSAAASSQQSEN